MVYGFVSLALDATSQPRIAYSTDEQDHADLKYAEGVSDFCEPNDSFDQACGPLQSGRIYHAYFPNAYDNIDYYFVELPAANPI